MVYLAVIIIYEIKKEKEQEKREKEGFPHSNTCAPNSISTDVPRLSQYGKSMMIYMSFLSRVSIHRSTCCNPSLTFTYNFRAGWVMAFQQHLALERWLCGPAIGPCERRHTPHDPKGGVGNLFGSDSLSHSLSYV